MFKLNSLLQVHYPDIKDDEQCQMTEFVQVQNTLT